MCNSSQGLRTKIKIRANWKTYPTNVLAPVAYNSRRDENVNREMGRFKTYPTNVLAEVRPA
jgi:hypothetical protein